MASKLVNIENPTLSRKYISLEEKNRFLDCLKSGEKSKLVAQSLNLNESTVIIMKSNEKRAIVCAGSSISSKMFLMYMKF